MRIVNLRYNRFGDLAVRGHRSLRAPRVSTSYRAAATGSGCPGADSPQIGKVPVTCRSSGRPCYNQSCETPFSPWHWPRQIEDTVKFLNSARERYRAAGWEVETIRIATQPFPQYTRGLGHDAALAILRGIDALGSKLSFTPSIGPAMSNDSDSDGAAAVDLLIDFLAEPGRTNAERDERGYLRR